MEAVTGGELFQILFNTGKFDSNMTRFYFKQISSAISYLHKRNIAHWDLKPENILIDKNLKIKLVDFGYSSESIQKTDSQVGTKEFYMSPEILSGNIYNAKKSDIFSLGVILFIMKTKKVLFKYAS